MNKKGMTSLLVRTIWVVAILILTFSIVYGKILAPFLINDKNSRTYENFVTLNTNIKYLTGLDSTLNNGLTLFEIEPGFRLIAFDSTEKSVSYKASTTKVDTVEKPKSCPEDKACICLFTGEGEGIKETNLNENLQEIKCETYDDIKFYSEAKKVQTTVGSLSLNEKGSSLGSIKDSSKLLKTDLLDEIVYPVFIQKVDSINKDVFINLYIEKYKTPDGMNHIIISNYDEFSDYRFNLIGVCSSTSSTDCINKKFNSAFTDSNGDLKSCSFNPRDNNCVAIPIEFCEFGLIESDCVCYDPDPDVKDNRTLNFGMCIDEKFQAVSPDQNICFSRNIIKTSSCSEYNVGSPNTLNTGKTDKFNTQRKFSCILDICELDDNCLYVNDKCKKCLPSNQGSCSEYGNDEVLRLFDPCDYDEDGLTFEEEDNGCLECAIPLADAKLGNNKDACRYYSTSDTCIKDSCGLSKQTTPVNCFFDGGWGLGGYSLDCDLCKSSCKCSDYSNKWPELRILDPCDCDGDGKTREKEILQFGCLDCKEIKDCSDYFLENNCKKNNCRLKLAQDKRCSWNPETTKCEETA